MLKKKENLTGWLFVFPALFAFLVFIAIPFITSLLLSLTEWDFMSGIKGIKFVGFENFIKLGSDHYFKSAIFNTFLYVVTTVPTSIFFSLLLAYALNGKVYFRKGLRLAFFIPYISSEVALTAVVQFMFRSDGIVNNILRNVFGVMEPPQWLSSSTLTRIPIILILFWTAIGYELIVFMAALQDVPKELYESSRLDGATSFQQFMKITIPMISPTTFYLIVVRSIAAFKVFTTINVLTLGTPADANTSLVMEIYQNGFRLYKFGYASAEAVVLFIILLVITLIQFWGQKKWVHYE